MKLLIFFIAVSSFGVVWRCWFGIEHRNKKLVQMRVEKGCLNFFSLICFEFWLSYLAWAFSVNTVDDFQINDEHSLHRMMSVKILCGLTFVAGCYLSSLVTRATPTFSSHLGITSFNQEFLMSLRTFFVLAVFVAAYVEIGNHLGWKYEYVYMCRSCDWLLTDDYISLFPPQAMPSTACPASAKMAVKNQRTWTVVTPFHVAWRSSKTRGWGMVSSSCFWKKAWQTCRFCFSPSPDRSKFLFF